MWSLCCYKSPSFMQWHQSGLESVSWLHWFYSGSEGRSDWCHVLLNCSSTSQNINQTKDLNLQWAPQKDIQDQADEPATPAEPWAQADTKRKAQVKSMSEPRLRDSSFYSCAYTLSGPLCRAKLLRMKYGTKQKKYQDDFGRLSVTTGPHSQMNQNLTRNYQVLSCLT